MKWKLNIPKPPMLVYNYVKLIGLAPFTIKKNRFYPPTLIGKVYPVSLAATYIFLSSAPIGMQLRNLRRWDISQLGIFVASFQYCITPSSTFVTLMIFVSMYKKILYIMNKLCDIGNEIKRLGIEENQSKFFKNTLVAIVLANIILIVTCVILELMKTERNIINTIKYGIDNWFSINIISIFLFMLFFIKQRFKLVNEKLYNVFRPAGHRRSHHNHRIFFVCENPCEVTQARNEHFTDLQNIQIIELLHLELCDLLNRMTHLFSIPILIQNIQFCADLMLCSVWIYKVVRNQPEFSGIGEIIPFMAKIFVTIIHIVVIMVQLISIAYVSVKTCQEGNATKAVLSKVRYEFKPAELEDEFFLFSLQLMHKPVVVSAFGFCDLGYSYVYKIFCAVVAYMIIFIQFDSP